MVSVLDLFEVLKKDSQVCPCLSLTIFKTFAVSSASAKADGAFKKLRPKTPERSLSVLLAAPRLAAQLARSTCKSRVQANGLTGCSPPQRKKKKKTK